VHRARRRAAHKEQAGSEPGGALLLRARRGRAVRVRAAQGAVGRCLVHRTPPPRPPPRTKWTRRVPRPVLNGRSGAARGLRTNLPSSVISTRTTET
jgi:hypothetical protein